MEYPVSSVIEVYTMNYNSESGKLLEKEFYTLVPISRNDMDIPYYLFISPALQRYRRFRAIKAVYWAGYTAGKIPSDLAAACMELASWNMGRYKGRRIGMTGNIKGTGIQGEHFEMSMPENVRLLLEPYRRKVI
jgi:hypothetical protein